MPYRISAPGRNRLVRRRNKASNPNFASHSIWSGYARKIRELKLSHSVSRPLVEMVGNIESKRNLKDSLSDSMSFLIIWEAFSVKSGKEKKLF